MNICIYGAASDKLAHNIIEEIENMSRQLARQGHSLIFGAGGTGAMGAAARGFAAEGANILGIAPGFMDDFELLSDQCTQVISVKTMSERKMIMETASDIFIITPGGIGTLDEFFEILTLKELGQKDCEILVLNIDDYYTDLESFLKKRVEAGIIQSRVTELYRVFTTGDEIVEYIKKM